MGSELDLGAEPLLACRPDDQLGRREILGGAAETDTGTAVAWGSDAHA